MTTWIMLVGFCIAGATYLKGLYESRRADQKLTALQARCRAERVEHQAARPGLDPSDLRVPLDVRTASQALLLLREPYFKELNRADQIEIFRRLMATKDARFRALRNSEQVGAAATALDRWTGKDLTTPESEGAVPERPECGFAELAAKATSGATNGLTGVQREIVQVYDAQQQAWDVWSTRFSLSILLALALSIPRLWYFIIKRISELSVAMRGKR